MVVADDDDDVPMMMNGGDNGGGDVLGLTGDLGDRRRRSKFSDSM